MTKNLLHAVETVARLTGDAALRAYRDGVRAERKSDGSDVSEADRGAERVARGWIESHFPGDGIMGEELGETNKGAPRRWLEDPIDGTAAFVRRVPLWGSLVAVLEGDTVLAGAIYCPVVDEMVVAETGAGCWWNGTRTRVSDVDRLDQAVVLTTTDRVGQLDASLMSRWQAFKEMARFSRGWGDCYGYLLVATGRADVMMDPVVSPWDAAALLPVINEAGGVFTDWAGRVTAFGGNTLATNGALARTVREQLGVPR